MPRVVRMLVLGRAVNRLGAFSLPFLALLLTQERGWSTSSAGLVMAGFGVATIPSRLAGGWMADHFGRRTTIVAGLAGCAVSQFGLSALSSDVGVVTAVVALGLSYEIYEPASQALIADAVEPDQQLGAHSAMSAALAAAGALAGGLAVILVSADLRWLFVADAASCVGAAVFLGLALPCLAPPTRAHHQVTTKPAAAPASSPWRDTRLLVLLLVQSVFAVVYLQSTVALPLSIHARGLPSQALGLVLVTSAVTMIVAQPVLRTSWLRGWSTLTRSAVGFAVIAVGLVGYAVVLDVVTLVLVTAVVALGDLVLLGQLITLASGLAPAAARARYLAAFGTSWGLASVAAPLVGTALLDQVGLTRTWLVLAGVCGCLAVTGSWWLPSQRRSGEDAPKVTACEASPPSKQLPEPAPSPSTATTSRSI